ICRRQTSTLPATYSRHFRAGMLRTPPEGGMIAAMEPFAVTLQVTPTTEPSFTSAEILPGRGMMTLQIRARLPPRGAVDLLPSPPLAEAEPRFERSAGQPFPGNESYFFGGAVLIPYANRIRGKLSADGRTIAARVLGREVTLPANAGGRRPGAEQY